MTTPTKTYFILRGGLTGYRDALPTVYSVASWRETDPGELPSGEYGPDWVVVKARDEREAIRLWGRKELYLYEDVAVDLFEIEAVAE